MLEALILLGFQRFLFFRAFPDLLIHHFQWIFFLLITLILVSGLDRLGNFD